MLDRIELLHDDVVADATALAALLDGARRAWRPRRAAPSVADVFARLDAISLHAARALSSPHGSRGTSGRWDAEVRVRLVGALDLVAVHAPWRRHPDALQAPERFVARQAAVRRLVSAVRGVLDARRDDPYPTAPCGRVDGSCTHAAVDALGLLVRRQRRLLDLALRIADRGGFLDASAAIEEASVPGAGAHTEVPWSAS